MAQNKTVETKASVGAYVKKIADDKKRKDFAAIIELVSSSTGIEPKMWGPAIVGFGSYQYKYDSGREGDAPLFGLAARVNAITLYLGSKFDGRDELLAKFGKYTASKGCVYIKKLEDIDTAVLVKMVKKSMEYTKKHNN